jgi:hypothetical protein
MGVAMFRNAAHRSLELLLHVSKDQHLGHHSPRMGVAMFHNAAHRSLESLLLHVSVV